MRLENKSAAHAVSSSTGGRAKQDLQCLVSAVSLQETGRLVKGGVGKDVTAVNLADVLVRRYHERTILADCGERSITLFEICKDKGIPVLYSSPEIWSMLDVCPETEGAAVMLNEKAYILCSHDLSREGLRWAIAHALGHILLGHLSSRLNRGKSPVCMEAEANNFAAVLLAKIDVYNRAEKGTAAPVGRRLCDFHGRGQI